MRAPSYCRARHHGVLPGAAARNQDVEAAALARRAERRGRKRLAADRRRRWRSAAAPRSGPSADRDSPRTAPHGARDVVLDRRELRNGVAQRGFGARLADLLREHGLDGSAAMSAPAARRALARSYKRKIGRDRRDPERRHGRAGRERGIEPIAQLRGARLLVARRRVDIFVDEALLRERAGEGEQVRQARSLRPPPAGRSGTPTGISPAPRCTPPSRSSASAAADRRSAPSSRSSPRWQPRRPGRGGARDQLARRAVQDQPDARRRQDARRAPAFVERAHQEAAQRRIVGLDRQAP